MSVLDITSGSLYLCHYLLENVVINGLCVVVEDCDKEKPKTR